jgi:hypothetical protein
MIVGIKKNYLKDCSQKYPDVSIKKVGCVADRILVTLIPHLLDKALIQPLNPRRFCVSVVDDDPHRHIEHLTTFYQPPLLCKRIHR